MVRCKIIRGLDGFGYCRYHAYQRLPICQGVRVGTKERCTNHAKQDYAYCCAAHDPTMLHITPTIFDPVGYNLRDLVQEEVVAKWDGTDPYNRGQLDLTTPYALHLDHIIEKQHFASLVLDMNLNPEELSLLVDWLRESVVNEFDNLALTRAHTNSLKGAGVWKYLDDRKTGHLGGNSFTSYLMNTKRDGKRLGRDVTRRITHCMGQSMKKCQRQLANEGETPVLEQASVQLQQCYVDMQLKQSSTTI